MGDGAWELRRHVDGYDWEITNATGRSARSLYINFEGRVDGKPWNEGVTPMRGVVGGIGGVVEANASLYINIFRSDTVTAVTVRWKSRFGRTRTWRTDVTPMPGTKS